MTASALYAGTVVHTRLRPKRHKLSYRVFSLLLDLDELEELSASLRLFGHNGPAVFSFYDSDHGDGTTSGLRPWAEAQLRAAGIDVPHPVIQVLCYPRIWGYVFNPLTVFFCSDAAGALQAILYEITNTFGERRTYVIRPDGRSPISHSCAKELYVSPFVPMDCTYNFLIAPPDEKVLVRINETDGEGLLLVASFAGTRRELTDATLLKALVAYPLMTLKVTLAIHWEALRLWLKGVRVIRHEKAPHRIATTVVNPHSAPAE
ncbi:MAG: DUF1365 domain-containing protein [Devosia sp.]